MNNENKILALDLGLRRIGVAISEGNIVSGKETIETENRDNALNQILQICREENPKKIILGMPVSVSGEGEDLVRSFALELNKFIDIPIEFVDETLTSKEAERILKGLKIDPRSPKYKKEIDRISAKLILEQYLNEHQN